MATRTIPVDVPLDLRATLRPLHGYFAEDGWWLPARTPDGAGTLHVRRDRTGIQGESWGPGGNWLLERLEDITGLRDDPALFHPPPGLVASLHRRHPGDRFGATRLVFDTLITMVCAQKVTGTEAAAASRGLRRRFSEPAPGPRRMLLPPDPRRLAAAPYHEYHEAHLEKRRAEVIRALSRHAGTIDDMAGVDVAVAAERLGSYEGVGSWTVAKTIEVSHGDPDQVAVGDFHFKNIVVHHMTGRERGTDEEMVALLEPYRPHRGRVIRLLHLLGHAPAFGPRMTPRDITRI
jgi:3-methyladenine DNA glycosylase/8-oxoguanine DNA glycosylase